MYQIVIDRSLCSGFGTCAELAPDVIELGADGIASLRVGTSADPRVLDAASGLPDGRDHGLRSGGRVRCEAPGPKGSGTDTMPLPRGCSRAAKGDGL